MEKNIKSKWSSRLLILVMSMIIIGSFTGCALLTENKVANEANDGSENDTKDTSKEDTKEGTSKDAEADDKDASTGNPNEVVAEAYIKGIDGERNEVTVDWIELLFATDEDRLKEIGMKSDDLVTGFYIYNEEEKDDLLSFGEKLEVELLEGTTIKQAGLTELEERIQKQEELFRITMKDNVVVRISQIYLP